MPLGLRTMKEFNCILNIFAKLGPSTSNYMCREQGRLSYSVNRNYLG